MNTKTAKKLAQKRTEFLKFFLKQLKEEIPQEDFLSIEDL